MSVKGLLLINLGSPEAPTPQALRPYLNAFLMDKYVIDIPRVLRVPLVYGLITPFRAPKSAAAFAKIWTPEGSPLKVFTKRFAEGVKKELEPLWSVRWAMRHGVPSLRDAVADWNVDDIYIVPLYPQYAESSTRSALEAAVNEIRQAHRSKRIFVREGFHAEKEFVQAQAAQISETAAVFKPDWIMLSFHGLPEHHMTKLHPGYCLQSSTCCDTLTSRNQHCYRAQAFATGRDLRPLINFAPEKISVSFQSRLGRRPWIKPYTDFVVTELAQRGVKRLLVSCPSFVADCLETLEEIQIRLREQFLREGGDDLCLVPALNDKTIWKTEFSRMISRPTLAWHEIRSSKM
jgi:protoporphyrin/coproporphyrin ferrochelatase